MAEFKHQCVQDLVWAVFSPPIISQPIISQPVHRCVWPSGLWYRQLSKGSSSWLKELDADPAALEALLSQQKDRRLGKYFETLWLYWLKHNPRYEIVENNVQVIIDGETLGEIDFIVFDNTRKQTIHWEVAVKFYLGAADTREMCNWHGPNCRDRLDIKVDHLLYKQSVISKNQRVKQWLQGQNIIIDQCAVILKGRLYYPWAVLQRCYQHEASLHAVTPSSCSTEHLFGCWFTYKEFDEVFDVVLDEAQLFLPLINQGWMGEVPTNALQQCVSKTALFKLLANKSIRLPLHLMLSKPIHGVDRVFIVDEHWPNTGHI